LVERILAGARDAENELVARFQPRVRAFVGSRTSDPDFVEDVTQSTLFEVIRALRDGRLRQADALASFVFGIARNQLADAIRKKAREKTTQMPEDVDFPAPQPEASPELMEYARREIRSLDSVDRKILWMILIEGHNPGEVGDLLGMKADAIRQRKSRALKKMTERLRSCPPDTGRLRLEGRSPR